MKVKLLSGLHKLSRALFLPVLILPVVGLLIALGNILSHSPLHEWLPFLNHPLLTGFGTLLSGALVPILSHLGIVFSVGVAIGLADKKRAEVGLTALFVYFVFNYAMHTFMELADLLADSEHLSRSGQKVVLGVQVFDMGIFLGILLGVVVALFHNRYVDKEFKQPFQIYGGTRFVVILLIPLTVLLAVASSFAWPVLHGWIAALGTAIHQLGSVGLLFYGMLERLLIPTGLHHLITTSFLYTSLGGVEEVGGVLFEGARNIYLAEIADPTVSVLSESVIWDARGISKMFGLTGACLAMYHTAKPENKHRVRMLLLPAVITSFFAGVTEPIEFTFIIIAPVLFVVHAFLSGLSMVVLNLFNVRAIGSSGFIDFFLYNIPLGISKTRWPYFILVGLIFFGLYYVIFRFAIQKFDLKTLGREEDAETTSLYLKDNFELQQNKEPLPAAHLGKMKGGAGEELNYAPVIVEALGGAENIENLTNCYSRLRVTVKDPERVNESVLKNETGASGVVVKDKNVQVIYGLHVNQVRRHVDEHLGRGSKEE